MDEKTYGVASCRGLQRIKSRFFDLYSDIYEIVSVDRKTYGGILPRRLQSEKTSVFNPYHDTKRSYLSTLERLDL